MATAIQALGKIQIGEESTKGTAVAATRVIPCKWTIEENQERYFSAYPRGQRARVGGGTGVTTMKGSALTIETELTAEDILWPLHTGVRGNVTPSSGTGDETWVFAPQLTTGILTLDSATVECIESDGSTNHYYGEFPHCMTESIGISYKENAPAMLKWKMFGRARATDTPTGALTEYADREPLVSPLLSVYLDETAYADIGDTQLSGVVRACDWELTTGLKPKYTADGRAALDFTGFTVGTIASTLKLTMELDAVGAARIAAWRAGTPMFIRQKYVGSAAGLLVRTVQVDGAYRFVPGSKADISDGDNGVKLVSVSLEDFYDVTGTKSTEITVINELAAL